MDANSDARIRRWKAATSVLALAVAFLVFGHRLEAPRDALAQVPDAGLQRQQMLKEMETSNRKLGEIADLLREIRDQRAEKDKGKPAPSK